MRAQSTRSEARAGAIEHLLRWSGLLLAVALIGSARAHASDNEITVRSGDRITGELRGADRDRLRFEAVRGGELSVRVRGRDGLVPALELHGPGGALDLAPFLRGMGSARLSASKLALPATGLWTLEIFAAGSEGSYEAQLKIKSPRSQRHRIALSPGGRGAATLDGIPPGARLRLRLRSEDRAGVEVQALSADDLQPLVGEDVHRAGRSTRLDVSFGARAGALAVLVRGAPSDEIDLRLKIKEARHRGERISLLGDPAPPAGREVREHHNAGMAALLRPDRIAELQPGRRSGAFTSFDRSGGNDDGFSGWENSWLYYRTDPSAQPFGLEITLLELSGAGILDRMHFAFLSSAPAPFFDPNADRYDLRIYLDGASSPTIVTPLRAFTSGALASWPFPLAGDEIASSGGPFNNTPIPFRDGIRVAATGLPHFYDFQYITLPEAGGLSSYSVSDDPAPVQALLARAGSDPKPVTGTAQGHLFGVSPEPGGSWEVFSASGEGCISRIEFQVDPPSSDALRDLWIEATFDGATTPQVRAPLGFLAGCGVAPAQVDAYLFSLRPDGHGDLFWPMPYHRSASLVLRHQGSTPLRSAFFRVEHEQGAYGGEFGYFHALHRSAATVTGEDYTVLERSGRGKIVGLSFVSLGNAAFGGRAYLEGDERVFIDGSQSPAIHGTGTEELFGWGWYDTPTDRPFTLPLHGYPFHHVSGGLDLSAMYRVFYPDCIHFERDIRFSLEHGPTNEVNAHYESVVYFYGLDEPSMLLSDLFDPTLPADILSHAYQAPGGQTGNWLEATYEGRTHPAPLRDRGVVVASGAVEFTIHLDPANRGALLRRRLDQDSRTGQRARVLVDGVPAGVWRTARNNQDHRWLDDEFDLRAGLTAGKTTARIRIEPLEYPWNEYHYWVFSRVQPR